MKRFTTFLFLCLWASVPNAGSLADGELRKCRIIENGIGSIVSFRTFATDGTTAPISGLLVKPRTAPPYPAMVLLHRYFGVEKPDCFSREINRYRSWGYAVLLVDSNSAPRQARSGDSGETPTGYNFVDQAADGLAAVAYLAERPEFIDQRIILVGHAYGGSAVLRAVSKGIMAPRLAGDLERVRARLSAAVAWHPSCPHRLSDVDVPLLVITGSKDRMNSHHACKVMDVSVLANTPKSKHAVFDRSGHNFDVDWLGDYDPVATEAAYTKIADFIDRLR